MSRRFQSGDISFGRVRHCDESGNFSVNVNDLRVAGTEDIPAIMSIERIEKFAGLIGHNTEEEHLARMQDMQSRYLLIGGEQDEIGGFAILTGLGSGDGIVFLKRIAVRRPGKGLGRQFLSTLIDYIFADPAHFRFWLEVFEHNQRARRAYHASGFVEEGILREACLMKNGQRQNLVVMSILRGDWLTAFI